MHFITSLILTATTVLPQVAAQALGDGNNYTVWASVVLNRVGERTPKVLDLVSTVLTSTGAQQMYAAGSFFRERYLTEGAIANIRGLSQSMIDINQLYALAFDQQAEVASAQAFMQGLYPANTPNTTTTSLLDPTAVYNGSYVAAPLNGYQYAHVHTADTNDPEHVYINAAWDCPAFGRSIRVLDSTNTAYQATRNRTRELYQDLLPVMRHILPAQALDFANAYALYDYVSYQFVHNATFASALASYTDGDADGFLTQMRYLADQEQQFELMNMTAKNPYLNDSSLPYNTPGSISTIGGNFLASRILDYLYMSIRSRGRYYKLSTLFSDYEPMMSLFALLQMPHTSSNFTGLPEFGSSVVFELYSWANVSNNGYPPTDSLYVALHFRNGSGPLTAYSAFGRGPSQRYMSWADFLRLMANIGLNDIGAWCTQCRADNIFCSPWNSSLSDLYAGTSSSISDGSSTTSSSSSGRTLSPAAAGAVGAVVALVVAALIFALVMLLGGIRFHRRSSRKTSELGGYKGSGKMASDRDLVLPSGAGAGADVDDSMRPGAHERTGSWEMKGQEKAAGTGPSAPSSAHQERQRARDEEHDDIHVSPFADPVQPRESF